MTDVAAAGGASGGGSSSAAAAAGGAGGAAAGHGGSHVGAVPSDTVSAVEAVVAALAATAQPRGVSADSAAEFAKVEEMTARAQAASRTALARRVPTKVPEPKWHAPWKLMRVISGHLGWVRALAVEPGNEWFATGSADRTIKIWDLASGTLRLTLTGHINTVRALAVSARHPYLFSAAEDKEVKCTCTGGFVSFRRFSIVSLAPTLPHTNTLCRLGPGDQQVHPAVPRPPVGRVRAGAAPHPGPAHDGRPRRRVPRVGHAHQGGGARAGRAHQHHRVGAGQLGGPAGGDGQHGQHSAGTCCCTVLCRVV